MLFKKNSTNLRDENFLTNKIKAKIATRATSLNIFLENIYKTNIKNKLSLYNNRDKIIATIKIKFINNY